MIRPFLDHSPFQLFAPPYDRLLPVELPTSRPPVEPLQGVAILWRMAAGDPTRDWELARYRPPGTALLVMLPPADRLASEPQLLEHVDVCNPQSVLPHDPEPDLDHLATALRRPPARLSIALTDYLAWRGIRLDTDTRRLIHRTVELAPELRSISGLSRALYLSRRALGRRFLSRGLPVPSHWLQVARLLHAVIRLQNTADSLFTIAIDLGYPDGFALSNQMSRLVGVRPSETRDCLGWEWVVEFWLVQERASGGLRLSLRPAAPVSPEESCATHGHAETHLTWPLPSSAQSVADSGATSQRTSSAPDAEPGH